MDLVGVTAELQPCELFKNMFIDGILYIFIENLGLRTAKQ